MKTKHALIIFTIGIMLHLLGALLKVLHLGNGNLTLLIAVFIEVIGFILLVYKLITHPNLKNFFNK